MPQPAVASTAVPVGPTLADFRVASLPEINHLLAQVRDGSVPIVLSAPDGQAYTSTLWSFDAQGDRISFSADAESQAVQRLLQTDEITAFTHLDQIKLQFELHRPMLVRGPQSCALQAAFPRELYRLQRRRGFRVRTSERTGPVMRLRHPSLPDMQLTLRLLDVSIGGCALLLPQDVPPLAAGITLHGAQIELDLDTRFSAAVSLLVVSSLAPDQGMRLGCEWQHIDGVAQRALQRYIDNTQRRRRLLAQG